LYIDIPQDQLEVRVSSVEDQEEIHTEVSISHSIRQL